jgi:electron transfer flavoprotein beta subunit
MISGFLDWPFISNASHMEYKGDLAVVTRDIEGGTEVIEVNGPFVVSAAKGLAEQRIPNMKGIMSAKTKPLQVIAPGRCKCVSRDCSVPHAGGKICSALCGPGKHG